MGLRTRSRESSHVSLLLHVAQHDACGRAAAAALTWTLERLFLVRAKIPTLASMPIFRTVAENSMTLGTISSLPFEKASDSDEPIGTRNPCFNRLGRTF